MQKTIKLFGTDGIRGVVNDPIMNPHFLVQIAIAAARILKSTHHTVILGGDTRGSYTMIHSALTAGFTSFGLKVINVGIASTPPVAYLTKMHQADFGVVISASHNPAQDNGLKFFDSYGYKIDESTEQAIEDCVASLIESIASPPESGLALSLEVGEAFFKPTLVQEYLEHLSLLTADLHLQGKKIALDCAHGALSTIAPKLFQGLGAEVLTIGTTPDGQNINKNVGATHPEALQDFVLNCQADFGIGFDGDGDRVFFVDKMGTLLEGDQILAIIAKSWSLKGLFNSKEVVGTVMSNRGLELFLNVLGLDLLRANVGDRHVVNLMKKTQALLGGESSGHIILSPLTTTGDGLLVALEVCKILQETNESLQPVFTPSPQVHHNIQVENKAILEAPELQSFLNEFTEKWRHHCSLLVRPSGTEPLIRITLQGEDLNLLNQLAQSVVDKVTSVVLLKAS